MRPLPIALAAAGLCAAVAFEASGAEPTSADRFEVKPVAGGFLRLDRESGLTAFCQPSGDGYACRPTAEGASADAAMVATLEKRVAALEAKVRELSTDPAALKGASPRDPTLDLPSDAQVDRVAGFLERAFRRLKRLADDVQNDVEDGRL